jgi:hypothetical protein
MVFMKERLLTTALNQFFGATRESRVLSEEKRIGVPRKPNGKDLNFWQQETGAHSSP